MCRPNTEIRLTVRKRRGRILVTDRSSRDTDIIFDEIRQIEFQIIFTNACVEVFSYKN